ncbi:MAG: EamA family transporter [Deltaproteobacteria bacterium]|nr:EamA family transporter [Deltaproteobacteria bacterium]
MRQEDARAEEVLQGAAPARAQNAAVASAGLRSAAVLFLLIVWGTQYLILRQTRTGAAPEVAAAFRYLLVLICAQVFLWLRRPETPKHVGWGARLAVGLFKAVSTLLVYAAAQRIDSTWTALTMATGPLFVPIFARLGGVERKLTGRTRAALALGAGGSVWIVGAPTKAASSAAVGAVLAAAALGALSKVAAKRVALLLHPVVMLRDMAAAVFILSALASVGQPLEFAPEAMWAQTYLALVGSAAASAIFFWLLRTTSVTRLGFLPFATSAVGVVAGAAVGEEVSAWSLAGALGIFAGGWLLVAGREPSRAPSEAPGGSP